jgi:N,N'-diacetyllegionaminate synthase
MRIGPVDLDHDVLVVAEIGNNHEGDVGLAEELVGLAAAAGAQAVKFQTIVPERLVGPDQTARLAQLRRFALSAEDHARLARAAAKAGVMFLSTPFDVDSVAMLDPLVPAFKVASSDNNFVALLQRIAATNKPVLLSTGMTDLAGARAGLDTVRQAWRERNVDPGIVLLQCVSAYPTPAAEANLRAIPALAALGAMVGYSDHTLGITAAPLAVALGARVIEKHFTIDHDHSDFRDHKLSVNPAELKILVERIREANALLGDGTKRIMPSEAATAVAARRSIVAARDLPAGHAVTAADLTWLRPSGGLPPGQEKVLIGRKLRRAVGAGHQLIPDLFD